MKKLVMILLTAALLVTGTIFFYDGAEAVGAQGAPGTPVGVGGIGYIDVTWAAAPGSPSQYYVYWSTVNGTVQISGYPTTVGGTTSHVMTGGGPDFPSPIPAGYTLYFQVCADYGSGYTYSGWSAPVTTTDYPGAPTNLLASASDGNVALSWSAPADDGGASIANYTIYRGTVSGSLVQIASVPGSSLAFLDGSAAGGQTFYYAVAAYNGYDSALSEEKTVTLPAGKPGVTENLQCAAGADNITLTWSAPAMDGGSVITDYRIYRSTVSGEEVLLGSTGGANLSYVDRGVVIGGTYYYQVAAVNALGESSKGSEASLTYVAPPSAPQNLQAVASSGQIRLTWEAPVSDGGSPIVWYDIYRNNLSAADGWTWHSYTEGALQFNDTNVQEGCTYHYKVVAWNDGYVEGLYSDVAEAEYALPSQPLNAAAKISGKGALLVNWTAPTTTGITGYVISWGPSPGTYPASATVGDVTSYLIDGLADGTTYYVAVAAVNGIGQGSVSNEASASTASAPGAVTDISKYNNGPGRLNIFWDAPSSNGGLAITKYTIYRGLSADDLAFLADTSASTTYYFDSGLNDGVTYYYKVTATNAVGEGAAAAISGKCGYPPSVPQNLTAVGGRDNITLTWEQPSYTGGGVTWYFLCRCATLDGQYTSLVDLDGSVTRYVDTVGQNETWFYKVYAGSEMGTSTFSNAASASSYGAPSAPSVIVSEIGSGTVVINWSAPAFAGNPSYTGYRLYMGNSTANLTLMADLGGDTTGGRVLGLTNGEVYYFAVLAYSTEFEGAMSVPIAVSPGTVPSMPEAPSCVTGDSFVMVAWLPSEQDGGREITAYELYRVEGESPDWSTLVKLVSSTMVFGYNDTSVINGHTYHYYVIAVNELGSSGYASMISCTPAREPTIPMTLEVEGGYRAIYLNWTAPADMGGGVLNYSIYRGLSPDDMAVIATVGNVTSYVDTSVSDGTLYYYRIAAGNWAGYGPLSPGASDTTIYRPGAPANLDAVAGSNTVYLAWDRPADDGSEILGYRIYRSISSDGTEANMIEIGTIPAYIDTDLVPGVRYYYWVAAFNSYYESAVSDGATAMPYYLPSAPNDLVVIGGVRNLTISWSAPSDDNGSAVMGYRVLVISSDSSFSEQFDAGLAHYMVVSGLNDGTSYSVQVLAYNLAGNGSYCAAAQGATPSLPGSPVASASSGDSWVNVSWTVPSSDVPISGYRIYRGTIEGAMTLIAITGDVTYFNDTSVENGQAYLYEVSAVSEVGEGTSGPCSAAPSRAPGASSGLRAVPGIGYVELTWVSPDDGGAPIVSYNIYRAGSASSLTWLATVFSAAYNDTEAAGGETYVYRVVAVNMRGEGAPAEITAAALLPPPAPTSLSVTRSSEGAVITWEVPENGPNSAPVTGFAIYRQSVDGDFVLIAVVNGGDARSFTDVEAPDGTASYRVATLNGGVTDGAVSMSPSIELSASDLEGSFVIVAVTIIAGFMVLFLLFFRRKDD